MLAFADAHADLLPNAPIGRKKHKMAVPYRKYIQVLGLSGIVRLSSESREESSGYQDDHIVEDIVARINDKPFRMRVHWISSVFKGLSHNIEKKLEITEQEYEEICKKYGGIIDTYEYRKKLDRIRKINNDIGDLTPQCPKCESRMVQRIGTYGAFWGCPNFPDCNGTRKITGDYRKEHDRLAAELKSIKLDE